jgi:hypothetical protein
MCAMPGSSGASESGFYVAVTGTRGGQPRPEGRSCCLRSSEETARVGNFNTLRRRSLHPWSPSPRRNRPASDAGGRCHSHRRRHPGASRREPGQRCDDQREQSVHPHLGGMRFERGLPTGALSAAALHLATSVAATGRGRRAALPCPSRRTRRISPDGNRSHSSTPRARHRVTRRTSGPVLMSRRPRPRLA